jgi:hypothetical protein
MQTPIDAYTPGKKLDSTRNLLISMKEKGTLQSYVAQHRNSPEYPYLLALAASVNQISDATKAAQHQPAPQTVADQNLNALAPAPAPQPMMQLPEESGIAQLPAPNMETVSKAAGGIIAFDEGGEVPRFQDQGLVRVPAAIGNPMGDNFTGFQGSDSDLTFMERLGIFNPANRRALESAEKRLAEQKKLSALTAEMPTPSSTPATKSPSNADIESMIGIGSPTKTATGAGSTSGAGKTSTPSGGEGASQGLAGLMKDIQPFLSKDDDKMVDRTNFMKEREDVRKPVYEKMTEMIEKEKGKLKDDKEQSFFMSLIEGGLAAAGGSSQYGLQNLAQGFAKGSASFGDSLKEIRKAARENSKMEMEATRMQAADKIGDMDAFQRSSEAFQDRKSKRDTAMNAAVFGIAGDKMRSDAQIKAARISASAPSAQERLFATLGGGDVTKGFKVFQEAQQDKTGASYAKLYSDYAANADKTGADKMSPIEFAQNIQMFMGALGGGGFQSKPGGDVYKLPGTK